MSRRRGFVGRGARPHRGRERGLSGFRREAAADTQQPRRLGPMNDRARSPAAHALTEAVSQFGPDVTVAERTIYPS